MTDLADVVVEKAKTVLSIDKWATNGHLIADVAELGLIRKEWSTLDVTYGYGTFWQVWQPDVLVRCDLNPKKSPDYPQGVDFTATPFRSRQFRVVVIDAPYKLNGTPDDSEGGVDERFGVDEATSWQDRMSLLRAGVRECARVADHVLLVKCQDQVVSAKIRWQTRAVAEEVEPLGFGLRARFDFLARRGQPDGRNQINPASCSSQLLVYQRDWWWSDLPRPEDPDAPKQGFLL